jgi:hypothetical protein
MGAFLRPHLLGRRSTSGTKDEQFAWRHFLGLHEAALSNGEVSDRFRMDALV